MLSELLERAEDLAAGGHAYDAISLLTAANRREPRRELEQELVRLRHHYSDQALDAGPAADGVAIEMRPSEPGGLTSIDPGDLRLETLVTALGSHGCALVRGLLTTERAAALREGIDQALDAFDNGIEGAPVDVTSPWYAPFVPKPGDYRVGGRRNWMRQSGGVWAVDSPRMLFELVDLIEGTGIADLVTELFGARPVLSANKCNLRRVPVDTATNWHQDGAFLGEDVRSLNLWLALGPCGVDAPGLDIVPRRVDHVVETGTPGAMFDWSIAPDVVADAAGDTPIIRPAFEAGDALLFDHLFVHRTGVSPGMTKERHAIEAWLFAPSDYPGGQIPVLL